MNESAAVLSPKIPHDKRTDRSSGAGKRYDNVPALGVYPLRDCSHGFGGLARPFGKSALKLLYVFLRRLILGRQKFAVMNSALDKRFAFLGGHWLYKPRDIL